MTHEFPIHTMISDYHGSAMNQRGERISPVLGAPHWLPVTFRADFKLPMGCSQATLLTPLLTIPL